MRRRAAIALILLVLAGACHRPPPGGAPAWTPDAAPAAATPDVVSGASPMAESSVAGAAGRDAGPLPVVKPGDKPSYDHKTRTLLLPEPLRGLRAEAAPVVVARGDDPADLVRRALDGVKPVIPRDAHVVLKVNATGYDRLKPGKPDNGITGRTTDPALVRALVLELRRRGARDISLGDSTSAGPEELARAIELSGFTALAKELDVPFLDLDHHGDADARPRPWRLGLPWAKRMHDTLLASDDLVGPGKRLYLVDVPKLKVHRFAVASLSIKNLMGAVLVEGAGKAPPDRGRWRLHVELSPWLSAWKANRADDRDQYRAALRAHSERLADLYGALTPDLVVIEGMPAVQGDGFAIVKPYGGKGIVIASTNGCYADYVAADFLGLADSDVLEKEIGVRMPPAIVEVASRYYGGADKLAHVVVKGDADWRGEKRPAGAWYKAMAPFEVNTPR